MTTITSKVTLQFDVYGTGKNAEGSKKMVIKYINKILQEQFPTFPEACPQLFETDIEVICFDEKDDELDT
jgi:hypothetical protein